MRIGILGAGAVGTALAALLTGQDHEVRLSRRETGGDALYRSPAEAAAFSELFILAAPYTALADALPPLRAGLEGKVVVDSTNPVAPDWTPLPLADSAAEEVARLLPGAHVVKAFNTVFADNMRADRIERGGRRITCFVAADDEAAAMTVAGLAEAIGFDPVVTGALAHARHLEALAHLNIALLSRNGMNTAAAFLYDLGEG